MYSLEQLRRGFNSPNLFIRELNRIYHRRLYLRSYNTRGVAIFDEDWDNLLILDACRYDMFEDHSSLPGRLEHRISRSSSTQEFLKANFTGQELLDTVYVTANPQYYRHRDVLNTRFHEVREIWQEEGWDDTFQTVLPETTTDHAIRAMHDHPDKRLLVHYIQPHYPFLAGDDGPFDNTQAFLRPDEPGSWNQVMTGELSVSREEVWSAYIATLNRVLPCVEEFISEVEGKTVVTSDHGNMVGERAWPFPIREWGHPRGIYTKHLVKVPWQIIEGTRREITADSPSDRSTDIDDDVVEQRLSDLGYR